MTTLPADELVERLEKRAETYNTGVAVPPNSFGTLGYYSSHDADLDRKAAAELSSLRVKLAEMTKARDKQMDYAIDLQRIIEDLCEDRLIRKPKTTARYHFNMAVKFQLAAHRLIEGNGNERL